MSGMIDELTESLRTRIAELEEQIKGAGNPEAKVPPMAVLLKAALKNEYETAVISSVWAAGETDIPFRMALIRLAGDEAKHYAWISERLDELEVPHAEADFAEASPLYRYLEKQNETFDRIVTGPFAREALAVARNNVFMEHCREFGDRKTLDMYEDIQRDESRHQLIGRDLLAPRLAARADLDRARAKVEEVLGVVSDIQEMLVMKKGLCGIPGC